MKLNRNKSKQVSQKSSKEGQNFNTQEKGTNILEKIADSLVIAFFIAIIFKIAHFLFFNSKNEN